MKRYRYIPLIVLALAFAFACSSTPEESADPIVADDEHESDEEADAESDSEKDEKTLSSLDDADEETDGEEGKADEVAEEPYQYCENVGESDEWDDEEAFDEMGEEFAALEARRLEWEAIEIKGTTEEQHYLLQKKLESMSELIDDYRDLRSGGYDAPTLFRTGQVFDNMAESMYSIEPPFEEDSEEFLAYRDAIDQMAYPLQEQGFELYTELVERAEEHGIETRWAAKACERLLEWEQAQSLENDGETEDE